MIYRGICRPHPVLTIEVSTYELERILEVLEGRKDTPTKDELQNLIDEIKRLLKFSEEK